MNHSDSIKAIAPAIVAAQAELKAAPKDTTNPFFKSKYADLGGCMDTLRPVLAAHKLALIQSPSVGGEIVSVETTLLHDSGEWISCMLSCHPKDNGPQSIGSAITYLRRYGLALPGLVTEADDDGNAAQPAPKSHPAPKPAPTPTDAAKTAARDAMLADMPVMQPTPPAFALTDAQKTALTAALAKESIEQATVKVWRLKWLGPEMNQMTYDTIMRTLSETPELIKENREPLPF